MDNRRRQKINYIELLRAIARHWKPVFQDKRFRRAMLKCIAGTIAFTAFGIFILSLNPTGKALGELMKEIEPPPSAILTDHGGVRKGLIYFYKYPGMNDEEVRSYYKKELTKKKWKFKKKNSNGSDIYIKSVYKDGYTHDYSFIVQRSKNREQQGYDWLLKMYME